MHATLPTRRAFLKSGALGAAALAAGRRQAHAESPGPKRNVVLFVTDDQGSGDAGCYGHPNLATPAMDELAANGVRFNRAYCSSPSCSASRSCSQRTPRS